MAVFFFFHIASKESTNRQLREKSTCTLRSTTHFTRQIITHSLTIGRKKKKVLLPLYAAGNYVYAYTFTKSGT